MKIFNNITTYLPILIICNLSHVAQASSPSQLQFGMAGSINQQAYKNNNHLTSVFPSLFYDSKYFYIDGDEIGLYAIHQPKHQLKANLYYDNSEFKPSGTLSNLNKRHSALMAGGSYTYISPYGGLQVLVEKDIQSRSRGTFATFAYLAEAQYKKWTISPELGLQWNDRNYNNYYYGISAAEAQTSQQPAYTLKQSIQPYIGLDIGYQISPHWTIYSSQHLSRLSQQQQRSPMVNKATTLNTTFGILYRF